MKATSSVPFTVKIRTGVTMARKTAHTLLPLFQSYGASLVTLHGRSKEQRYAKRADWEYISECAKLADPMPLFGNGDVLGWEDYYSSLDKGVSGVMIGRGALIKPWLFKEIKERKVYDISATERLDIMKEFTRCGLEYWGSDTMGVNTTRRYVILCKCKKRTLLKVYLKNRFLCEWLSFACRYIPAGLLEVLPQRMNERPPAYRGRNELETLMASDNADDWVKLSELVLGPAPDSFKFLPK